MGDRCTRLQSVAVGADAASLGLDDVELFAQHALLVVANASHGGHQVVAAPVHGRRQLLERLHRRLHAPLARLVQLPLLRHHVLSRAVQVLHAQARLPPATTPRSLYIKGKRSPHLTAERRIPELIPVLGSQPAGDVSHEPGGRLSLLSARPAVTLATLKRAATDGCEQFAQDCYPTASQLRFEPGPSAPAR